MFINDCFFQYFGIFLAPIAGYTLTAIGSYNNLLFGVYTCRVASSLHSTLGVLFHTFFSDEDGINAGGKVVSYAAHQDGINAGGENVRYAAHQDGIDAGGEVVSKAAHQGGINAGGKVVSYAAHQGGINAGRKVVSYAAHQDGINPVFPSCYLQVKFYLHLMF